MEDFLKFLLIAGVILVGIFREVNKNSKSKKATNKRPVSPIPSPTEIELDAIPIPEAWGSPKSPDELIRPIPFELPTSHQFSQQASGQKPKQKKKKEQISVTASIAKSAAQDELNSKQGSHYNTPSESVTNSEDFIIHSAKEARRAIIWGEILQRKY